MAQFVVDASVALSWYFRDAESELSQRLSAMTDDHQLLVPPHWFSEVTNGIRMEEMRGRCSEEDAPSFIALLGRMRYMVDRLLCFAPFEMILPFAREHTLTVTTRSIYIWQ